MRKLLNALLGLVIAGLAVEVFRAMEPGSPPARPADAVTRTRVQPSVTQREIEPPDSFDLVASRSLFHPDREELPPESPSEDAPAEEEPAFINVDDLFLQGTMIAEPERYAFIIGPDDPRAKRYGIGDEINQFEIERILPDQVFLASGDQHARLTLKTQWNSKGGNPGAAKGNGRKGAATASGPRGAAVQTGGGGDMGSAAARFKKQQMQQAMASGKDAPPPPNFMPPEQTGGPGAGGDLPWGNPAGNLPPIPISGSRFDSGMYDEPDYVVPLGEEGEIGLGDPAPPPAMFSGNPSEFEPPPPPPPSEEMPPSEPPPDRPPRMSGM